MVAHFLGLRLRLLANSFRRSPWQVTGTVIALLYGGTAAAIAVLGLAALRFADVETARSVIVVSGSCAVLGFLLIPLVFGVDDTLDPRRFALFGIPDARLASLLALTALVGVPGFVIAVVAAAQVGTWARSPGPTLLAVIGAVLIVVTCVLGARVTTSLAALLLATRRAREISGLAALFGVVLLTPSFALIAGIDSAQGVPAALVRMADVLSWTPLGAAWAAPADAALGNGATGVLKLLIAAAFAGVLWLVWRALVAAMLLSPHREGRGRRYSGLGFFGALPATPVGAIAARSLTYWFRDARYRVQLIIVPIVPMLMIVVLLVSGVYWQNLALLPLPVMCLFLGWSAHNDVAYDNTAIWLHVVSNTSGVADRVGRIVPVIVLGSILIAAGAPLSAAFYGDPTALPSIIGVSACILLSGLGFSSLASARFPYPAVRPGDSPFSQPQTSGAAASIVQSLIFVVTVTVTTPSLLLGLYGLAERGDLPLRALWVGIATGLCVLVAGVWGGARLFDRRGPEILAFTLRN